MNIYRHTFTANCPINGDLITYHLEIRSAKVIRAEFLEATCAVEDGLHEDIADLLSSKLGGEQRLVAQHGRVEIETLRP